MEGKFFHAYIVGGARGSARRMIENFLRKNGVELSGNPDYLVCETVSFSVEHSRDVKDWQSLAPLGKHKICVVYADFITPEAQNALLKIFEEPSLRTHLILAIPKPEMLLPTLLSRARVIFSEENNNSKPTITAFLEMSLAERLKFVGKLAEKSDEEDSAAVARSNTLSFVEDMEKHFAKDPKKNFKELETVMKLKKYLYTPGCSLKNILETLVFLV